VPARFEAGATLEFRGDDINGGIESAYVGTMALPVVAARDGAVQVVVPATPTISAGEHPVVVARRLASGREQTSNALFVKLLPTLLTATHGALTANGPNLFGVLTLAGERLGGPGDTIFVAFYRDGVVVRNLEIVGTAAQTSLVVTVASAIALPPGTYHIIVRVNDAQASLTPAVAWTP